MNRPPEKRPSPEKTVVNSATQRTNEDWLAQLRAGGSVQADALSELRSMLLARLRASLTTKGVRDAALPEDTVQEALLRILERLDQFAGKSRFTTWATTIAVRAALSELRRRHWKDVSLDDMSSAPNRIENQATDDGAAPQVRAEQTALLDMMHQLIERRLTDKQRTALLAELDGMPLAEIGRRMGTNRNAVYKLTHDARKRLKAAFEAEGYDVSDVHSTFGG